MSTEGPKRLLDYGDELDGLLRGALRAERAEPDDDARLARIGHALSIATTTAAPPASPPAAHGKPGWLAAKGPFVALAAATIGGLAIIGMTGREPPPPARTQPAVVVSIPLPPAESPIPTISPADLPSAPAESPPPSRSAQRAAPAVAPSEGDEIALLARAHDALQNDPARSLALCSEHEAKFAAAHFTQEREALAIEALVKLGRRDEAVQRWNTFRERYPTSSHRVHLASLFSAPPSGSP